MTLQLDTSGRKPVSARYADLLDTVKVLRDQLAEQRRSCAEHEDWFRSQQISKAEELVSEAHEHLMANDPEHTLEGK